MTEKISEIVEVIKTLNLNVDSETLILIVQELKPLLWFFIVSDLLMRGFLAVIIIGLIFFGYKAISKMQD